MNGNIMVFIDILLFGYLLAGIINPALWIQKPELKNDVNERAKMRKIAIALMVVEIIFCVFEYVV